MKMRGPKPSVLNATSVTMLRGVRPCSPLFSNMILAELFDARHTRGDLKVLPTTDGRFIVFREGRPNGEGVVAGGFRTEDEAHGALERHAGARK